MSHPVDPGREDTHDVFTALLDTLPEADREVWRLRWRDARMIERRRRDYDRKWDESLMGIGYDQSGNPFVKRFGQ